MVTFRLPDLLLFFQGLGQLYQASFLWQEVGCLWLEAEHLETKGLQQVEFVVAKSKVEDLYAILQEAMTWPEPSTSVGLPLPRGTGGCPLQWSHAWLPKRPKLQPWVHWNRGPSLTCSPTPGGQHTHWDDALMCQCRGCLLSLSLPGQGVSWGTFVLPCHHLCSYGPCPSGHKTVVSLLPHYVL